MAPLVGLEPTTCGLTVRRSTDWAKEEYLPSWKLGLCWHYLFSRAVARQVSSAQMSLTSVFGMGTGGPSSQSTRTFLVTHTGFEPMLTAWEAAVLTTWPMGHLVHPQGLEPGTHWLRVSCSTNWAKGADPLTFQIHPENWTLILSLLLRFSHWACALVKLSAY